TTASRSPSGLRSTLLTAPLSPVSCPSRLPVSTSQAVTWPPDRSGATCGSRPAHASRLPSRLRQTGPHASDRSRRTLPTCPPVRARRRPPRAAPPLGERRPPPVAAPRQRGAGVQLHPVGRHPLVARGGVEPPRPARLGGHQPLAVAAPAQPGHGGPRRLALQ